MLKNFKFTFDNGSSVTLLMYSLLEQDLRTQVLYEASQGFYQGIDATNTITLVEEIL